MYIINIKGKTIPKIFLLDINNFSWAAAAVSRPLESVVS
jgi:hypothetical protein